MSSHQDVDETVRADDLYALAYTDASASMPDSVRFDVEECAEAIAATGWTGVDIRSGIAGKRSESRLGLAASRA